MLYLGIDQHRKQLTVCVRSEQGDVLSPLEEAAARLPDRGTSKKTPRAT